MNSLRVVINFCRHTGLISTFVVSVLIAGSDAAPESPWGDSSGWLDTMVDGARMASGALEMPGVGTAADIVGGAADASDALGDLDREIDNAMSQPEPGNPTIPVSCQGSDDCAECYERAYTQLARQRILLARLQSLYVATHRFAETSQTLGDSIAGLHPQAGVGWGPQKLRISSSLANFDAAYDRKREAMLGVLKDALIAIGECEARHFNNRDWFTRYGFMYLEFMSTRYSRPGT